MAAASWRRQVARNFASVDQVVSSKARRAAAIARSTSASEASAASPMSSSVAGLIDANVAPPSAGTNSPSISSFVS